MPNVPYSEVIPYLLEALPSIRQHYERTAAGLYAENNPHVVFGSILVEYIQDLARARSGEHDENSEDELNMSFSLLENMASSSDPETIWLIETSVLEGLLGEKGGLESFAPYMGPATRELARKVAESWELDAKLLDN
jgi:hypothetical protein